MRAIYFLSLFLTAASFLCASEQANALEAGDRGSYAQLQKSLSQEHQVEIARATYVLKNKVLCAKFTINAQGDAYILLQDSFNDDTAQLLMVVSKLKNARAYDPHRLRALPQGVAPESNLANFIRHGGDAGVGVMLHGQNIKKLPDGLEKIDGLMTVVANVTEGDDPAVNDTVAVLLTTDDDIPHRDPFVATYLVYRGYPNR